MGVVIVGVDVVARSCSGRGDGGSEVVDVEVVGVVMVVVR